MKRRDDGEDVGGRQPGFYLYPEDLERELRPLPLEAQALWVRMLIQMHWAPRRGYLEHPSGQPFSADDLARLVGIRRGKCSVLCQKLEHVYGVFSRDENGVIFNRRMVRDTLISKKRKEAGAKGGNPLLKPLDNQIGLDLDNQSANQNGSKSAEGRARVTPSPIPVPFPVPLQQHSSSSELNLQFDDDERKKEHVRTMLLEFPEAKSLSGKPDDAIVCQCLEAVKGNDRLIAAALEDMHRKGKAPSKSWAWFPTVLNQYFGGRRIS